MTRTLILTRHAKSSWANAGLDDHDRPLNDRGLEASAAIGNWMQSRGHVPDAVLSSTAQRTRDTWTGIAAALATPPEPTWVAALYHADAEAMLEVLRGAEGTTVLVLGHNPGIADFAARLLDQSPALPGFLRYPSGATTVIRFQNDAWTGTAFGAGQFIDFVKPRDLD
jgi:phosphohistidine phosphatase